MGKLEASAIGKIKGKIGNLVFYNRDGQTYVRKKADHDKRKLSALQIHHQQIFKIANTFLYPFKEELNFTMAAFAKGGKKGFHHGLSWLLKNGVLHGKIPKVLPEKLLISMGSLPPVSNPIIKRQASDKIHISWDSNAWEGSARDSDQAYVLLYDPVRLRVSAKRSGNYRRNGEELIKIPWDLNIDDKVWVFFAFFQIKKKIYSFSNSVCLGLV